MNPNLLTAEEMSVNDAPNALVLVQRLRPAWLRSRGDFTASRGSRPAEIILYLDGARFGTWRDLEKLSRSDLKELRYYSATEATTLWGTGHSLGAITATTK